MDVYPETRKQTKFFALRFTRILAKSCAAQHLGPEGCWLLSVIVGVEDAKKYSGAVAFYNEQLAPMCGFASIGRLIRARKRCVEAGWLHYVEGGKRKPAAYWVKIPKSAQNLNDAPVDESFSILEEEAFSTSNLEVQTEGKRKENGRQTEGNRSANGSPPILYPVPSPDPNPNSMRAHAANGKSDITAAEHVACWMFPKPMQGSERCRMQLVKWQEVRRATHGSFTQEAAWEATAIKWPHWTEDQWFTALLLSTQTTSKVLCNGDNDFQKRRTKAGGTAEDPRGNLATMRRALERTGEE